MNERERAIEKIRKFLALAEKASNEHEANNALIKAKKYAAKYNISFTEVYGEKQATATNTEYKEDEKYREDKANEEIKRREEWVNQEIKRREEEKRREEAFVQELIKKAGRDSADRYARKNNTERDSINRHNHDNNQEILWKRTDIGKPFLSIKKILFILAFVLFAIYLKSQAGAKSESSVKHVSLYDRQHYITLAQKGDSNAQFSLASMYVNGTGGDRDYIKARYWFLESAKQGNTSAQTNYGILLAKGLGGNKDFSNARKWFLQAAKQNDGEAYYNLAALYNGGWGVKKNSSKAIEYARLSCVYKYTIGCDIHKKLINSN